MSRTYDLVCDDCKLCFWIGQGRYGEPNFYVYTAEPNATQLAKFLVAHIGHKLRFLDDERTPDDYSRVDEETGAVTRPDWMDDT